MPVEGAPSGAETAETPMVYPSISIEGDAADAISAGLKAGDTFTAEVTFKVGEMADGSLELEATHFEAAEPSAEAAGMENADDGQSAADAVDSYMKSKGQSAAQ